MNSNCRGGGDSDLMKETPPDKLQLNAYQSLISKATLDTNCDCALVPKSVDTPFMPLPFPIIYSLELTALCNNRCPGCGNTFAGSRKTRAAMPLDQWMSILDKVAPYTRRLKLTGGEPTLHPQFEQIVRAVAERGMIFTLFTNARWQDPEHLISLLLDTPQCAGLLISLHSADAESHEAFTSIAGSFDETVRNILRAADAGLRVHTNAVLTRHNHRQVESIVDLSQSLGAERAIFNRYIGRALPGFELSLPELTQAIHKIERIKQESDRARFGSCIPLCFADSSSTGCLAGIAYCTIDPWGNVRPCNHAPQIAGNLLTGSLSATWYSETMQAWRNLVPNECENCDAFATCHGGCRADAVLKGCNRDPLITMPIKIEA